MRMRLGFGSGIPSVAVLMVLVALDVLGVFLFPSWLSYVLFIVPPLLVILWMVLRRARSGDGS